MFFMNASPSTSIASPSRSPAKPGMIDTRKSVRIVFGPGRHPTSSAIFLYFEGPDGMVYEYSTGVRMIDDETTYTPRQFPFEPSSFCMWGSRPDIAEFKR